MSDPTPLALAEIERDLARERVMQTLGEVQDRLNPKTLARKAAQDLTEAGTAIADASMHTVKRNPGTVAGATALAGLFLARHRIAGLFRRKPRAANDPDAIL